MMSFSTQLKRVVEDCKFEEEKNQYLRDFFTHSLVDDRDQSELWENPESFADVVEAARKCESELRKRLPINHKYGGPQQPARFTEPIGVLHQSLKDVEVSIGPLMIAEALIKCLDIPVYRVIQPNVY